MSQPCCVSMGGAAIPNLKLSQYGFLGSIKKLWCTSHLCSSKFKSSSILMQIPSKARWKITYFPLIFLFKRHPSLSGWLGGVITFGLAQFQCLLRKSSVFIAVHAIRPVELLQDV